MILRELSRARLPRVHWAALCYGAAAVIVALFWYQIGHAVAWFVWQLPNQVSPDFARLVVAVAGLVVGLLLLILFVWPRARGLWPYITWVYAGAVTGVCLAFLPILIDLSISTAHFYHLMWFRNWI
jgi:uncharacterized protein YacL